MKLTFCRFVSSLLNLTASSSHCCLATNSDELKDVYALLLCNAIGTPMDSKYIGLGKSAVLTINLSIKMFPV